ncbi:AI-2E family transporter [Flavobacterium sp. SUN052]|uniref:AI-2E family transporter n=1 Tax=Flavobacterium sp. SUN052 TaxID=3002441 RepID=UPI00237D6007|nr:AI-2E family transporter [Flavobacterium sp. SUN052]MEC4005728.1 AI-2E family transporter [Flavobacterium sp. SUN052]
MTKTSLPFSAQLSFILIAIIATAFLFYVGQDIIIPLLLSVFFAIILQPIVHFLKNYIKIPRIIGAIIAVTLFLAIIIGVFTYISFQVGDIVADFDKIQNNLNIHINHAQRFIKENFNLSSREQKTFINEAAKDSIEKGKELIGVTLTSFSNTVLNLILIPIYTFLILIYTNHFKMFLTKLIDKSNHHILNDILIQIKSTVKSYIFGLILEMVFVSVLTSIGLMIIGIKYAIVLGIITGILNLIPYIGILFAGVLTIIASLTGSSDLSIVVGVIVVNVVVQLIDNNILVPLVVSSKVQINAIATIIGILIGGALAGISGMFLAIPIIAILKVVFDRIEHLEAWGYLLGDDLPKTHQWKYLKIPSYDYENFSDSSPVNNTLNITITKNTDQTEVD